MFRAVNFQQLAAKLAIFSIAMLFLAPLISRSLIPTSLPHHSMAMSTMPMMDMPQVDSDTLHQSVAHEVFTPNAIDEFACGYCQLLVHFPFLHIALALILWLTFCQVACITFLPPHSVLLAGYWTPGRPRGPPY